LEGAAIATLFEQFNIVHGGLRARSRTGEEESEINEVEVVSLIGPYAASRREVLSHLDEHAYDVLHYAGHCAYEENRPELSGWIFAKKPRELITTYELAKVDHIPKFVFSNACESGITSARSGQRSAGLAPNFAERFFERGVSNFVCTAWPVDDVVARHFALTLYQGLLGLRPKEGTEGVYEPAPPLPMHIAMREARRSIAKFARGYQTWGAYQHYGSPYLRFFEPASTAEKARAAKKRREAPVASPAASG
jgi:hypothetical protein